MTNDSLDGNIKRQVPAASCHREQRAGAVEDHRYIGKQNRVCRKQDGKREDQDKQVCESHD